MLKQQYYFTCICQILWVCCTLTEAQTLDLSLDTLKLSKVIAIFRHGVRAPLRTFKSDPYSKADQVDVWPEGLGTLVNEGKNQMYELGKHFRERYSDILIPHGNTVAKDVQLVSTPVHRCYQTGFYPSNPQQIWNDELFWQPVSIRSTSPDKTYIVENEKNCPRYHKEISEVLNATRNNEDYKAKYEYLRNSLFNYTQVDIEKFENLKGADGLGFAMGDYMYVKKALNLKLPDWATDDFLTKLSKVHLELMNSLTSTSKLRDFLIGPLIKDIIHRIQGVIDDHPSNSKFYFYAGHDISVAALFDECNLKRDFIPTYGASFIFEVYRSSSNNYFVRVLFSKDHSLKFISVQVLPNCEVMKNIVLRVKLSRYSKNISLRNGKKSVICDTYYVIVR